MLVLSRKSGEEIKIGRDITIVVRRIAGNRVALGVDAPSQMRILRGELQRAVEEFRKGDHGDSCEDGREEATSYHGERPLAAR